jgi:predicted aldo/keto reductase-like oxidoreductase
MKSLAAQNAIIPREFNVSPRICRRFSLSMPVSTLVCGIQTEEELKSDLEMARDFKPLTEDKIAELLEISCEKAMGGEMEAYKTGNYGCDWHHDRM